MNAHFRANLWLLGLTVLLCCVLYPLMLWGIGQGVFPNKASGSLIDKDGKPVSKDKESEAVGSRLIGQPFNGPEYFQPRPSAPSYDASASGGSNLSANNPKLRRESLRRSVPSSNTRVVRKRINLSARTLKSGFSKTSSRAKPPSSPNGRKGIPSRL